jgi:TetR/AcrR family transcriptional regulator, transcriptional repressor for nem operon
MKNTKELILKTAYNMFLYNNYEAVTIKGIIKATGLTKGAIYHYFDSKEVLFKAVIEKYLMDSQIDNSVEHSSLLDFIHYTYNEVKTRMSAVTDENSDFEQITPLNYIYLLMTAHRYYPGFTEIGRGFFRTELKKIEKIISKAITTGEIRDNINSEIMASILFQIGISVITNIVAYNSIEEVLKSLEDQYNELYKSIKKQ